MTKKPKAKTATMTPVRDSVERMWYVYDAVIDRMILADTIPEDSGPMMRHIMREVQRATADVLDKETDFATAMAYLEVSLAFAAAANVALIAKVHGEKKEDYLTIFTSGLLRNIGAILVKQTDPTEGVNIAALKSKAENA